MTDAVCATLDDRAILRIAGADARTFLQGLISNDIQRLAPDRALYAALLTPQGKYLFDFILVADGDAILLDTECLRVAELRQRLLMYRLRAKVTIEEPLTSLSVLAVFGPEAAACLGLLDEPGAARRTESGPCFVDPRLAELGARVILPETEVARFAARHGLERVDASTYDRHRLALGVPDGSRDLIPQKSTLLESNFEELHGVSFEKGCYVGQELTARTKHRGLVKKRLFPVRLEGPAPEPGTIVTAGEQDAGEMRSSAAGQGIALLRLEPALAALRHAAELRAGETRVLPSRPAWIRLERESETENP